MICQITNTGILMPESEAFRSPCLIRAAWSPGDPILAQGLVTGLRRAQSITKCVKVYQTNRQSPKGACSKRTLIAAAAI